MLYYIILYYIILYYITLYYIILFFFNIILYYIIFYFIILYYIYIFLSLLRAPSLFLSLFLSLPVSFAYLRPALYLRLDVKEREIDR